MHLINAIISRQMIRRMDKIIFSIQNASICQKEILSHLLITAKDTAYGKQHGFEKIETYETFRERVPLCSYEDLHETIDRIRKGKQNLLWPTQIKWFAKSSGTTAGISKFLPLSYEAIESCHFKGGKDLLALYCHQFPKTTLFSGFSLRLGGSTNVNSTNHESYFGDLSALLIENLPFWVEVRSTPNQRIALMEEWESKIHSISAEAIDQNVTSLFGVPSWMLVLCKHILQITGKNHMHEVWPNMELYGHGGVSFGPYRKQFESLFPEKKMTFMETYNASEGFFAVQDDVNRSDLLLFVNHGVFYEFIPMTEFSNTTRKAIPLSEVQIDVNYALVITTNSGLWRYIIGDTVKFTTTNPFRIKITGRTKHFINAFGEELIIENAEQAINSVCADLQITVNEYSAAPVYMKDNNAGAHEWIIEFETPPKNLRAFSTLFDAALKAQNTDYQAKRHKDMALQPPIIHIARKGLFHDWLKKHQKLGGQHKVPRLRNDRELMEELLLLNKIK